MYQTTTVMFQGISNKPFQFFLLPYHGICKVGLLVYPFLSKIPSQIPTTVLKSPDTKDKETWQSELGAQQGALKRSKITISQPY